MKKTDLHNKLKSIIEEEGSDDVIETAPSMDRYVDALRKTQPKN